MKKKLLFVIPSLDAGGGEKGLVNLLNTIDFDSYEVDLLAFQPKGLFFSSIPKQVNVLTIQGNYADFTSGLVNSCLTFLKSGKIALIFHRIVYSLKNKLISNTGFAEQSSWKNLRKAIPMQEKNYDVAIGFMEKSCNYYTVDRVNATQIIGWIHTNYSKSGMQPSFDLPYFSRMDFVVTVSHECELDLQVNFPNLPHKFKTIHNIVSAQLIRQLAADKPAVELDWTLFTIITVARLSHEKGCDMAVEACQLLVQKGLDVQWLLIGDGNERHNLAEKVTAYGLQNRFLFLGLQANPYPFVKNSTFYVQPSRYEGKSIAIDEAKILQKPIVVTDFSTAKDQIVHLKNGIISPMDPQGLAEEIFKLYQNKSIQSDLVLNLSHEQIDSELEIEKLYALIHD
ncbi:glycosyltransferase [Flavobacterium lacus]|uniref:Glycosyltransferase involved in cell wall biosynthesis n=1 Tax=Flavobacterium lacus TaxID=1353778 RepID=A0A328X1B4_9FLAO|nr:glycosyltransferase [Flavobacterium lacus]RAR51146.1 glycosyltransferase involved in cell wall biosynthesis [Flavobacterium lacus]